MAVLGLLAILVFAAPSALAATFTVTKTADTADGTCDADCSLREAVIAANAAAGADTIILPAGTYVLSLVGASEDASATGDLDITGDLTITGAGAATTIVDGNATDRVFHILTTASAVTMTGLTVRNGNVAGFGGGINKEGSGTVQLQNAIVTSNTSQFFGGGINLNDNLGSLTLDFTTVSNNVAGQFGGGINNNNAGSLTVRDSTVSGNTAAGFGGGGINNNFGGTALVVRSTISGNTAQNGAGINNNSSGSLNVSDTLISGNTATGSIGGGGILNNSSGPLTVFASTISANASAGFGGGGIDSNSSGAVDIQISTISGNSTTGSNGGGGLYKNSGAVITVVSSTITDNSSTNGGRNVHSNSSSGSLSLLNTIVANAPSGTNCGGNPVTSSGFNLSTDASCNLVAAGDRPNQNPLLAPLANNGGPTPTHGLQAGSPAIDNGTATSVPIDQRGVVRPVGPGFDIGAFEGTLGAALPTLSIGSASAAEGNSGTSSLTFTVTLSAASAQTVTVNFATADGTATAGSDYSALSGVVTFTPGITSQPIAISILGDTTIEASETFVVNLSGAANATIASGQGTGTIVNDDAGAPPPIATDIPTLSEWGTLLLGTLLAGLAMLALRRRDIR